MIKQNIMRYVGQRLGEKRHAAGLAAGCVRGVTLHPRQKKYLYNDNAYANYQAVWVVEAWRKTAAGLTDGGGENKAFG